MMDIMMKIIFASVLTRRGVVEDAKKYGLIEAEQRGHYRSDDVEMEEVENVSSGSAKGVEVG